MPVFVAGGLPASAGYQVNCSGGTSGSLGPMLPTGYGGFPTFGSLLGGQPQVGPEILRPYVPGSYDTAFPPGTFGLIQQAVNVLVGQPVTVFLSASPQPSSMLVAWITDPSVVATNATLSGGGVQWIFIINRGNNNNLVLEAGYGASGAAGTNQITVSFDNGGNHAINISEWAAPDFIQAFDVQTQTGGSVATVTSASLTPTYANELIMAAFDLNNVETCGDPTNSFVNLSRGIQGVSSVQAAWRIVSSIASYSAAWTLGGAPANGWDTITAGFHLPMVYASLIALETPDEQIDGYMDE